MSLPYEFVDSHHHFIDTTCSVYVYEIFLATVAPDLVFLPEQYTADVVDELEKAGVAVTASVHVDA